MGRRPIFDRPLTNVERQRRHREKQNGAKKENGMLAQQQLRPTPPPLPATAAEYLERRNVKTQRSFNDYIEDIHLQLVGNDEYDKYLYAVYPEQAVEGSLIADLLEAAELIRSKAKSLNIIQVMNEKKATIGKALRVVQRRYDEDPKSRRNKVGGTVVAGDDADDEKDE
jgi:hypothetical protein